MTQGTIAGINPNGFGFIKVEGREGDVFFHNSDLVNARIDDLQPGDKLEFEIVDSGKGDGKQKAANVSKI
jgi:cold shock CspA family protein